MKRTGKFALPLATAMAMQGCLLFPVENNDSNDPFFFDPGDTSGSADFAEVGHSLPNSHRLPAASRQCSVGEPMGKKGSACWFFPIVRVY